MWYLYNEITGMGHSDVSFADALQALIDMLTFHARNSDKVRVTMDPKAKKITVSEPPKELPW